MRPRVSVVMPVLNGERFIGEAIASVAAQTYREIELVVVDDGSTDNTRQHVDAFRDRLDIRYVRHERPRGIAPSMNDGVRNATGTLIAFLDHDDGWFPDFLETQVSYLEKHPDVGLVHSDFQTIDVDGRVIEGSVAAARGRKRPSGHVFRELFMDSFIVGNSVVVRRECFERLGLFEESLRWGDYHMWLRIARHYRVDYTDKVLVKYRQHPTQSTRSSGGRPDEKPVGLQAIESILKLYPEVESELGAATVRSRVASFYFDLAYGWFIKGESANARVCLRRALALTPTDFRTLKLFAATFIPSSQTQKGRRLWRRLRGERSSVADSLRGLTN